MSFQCHSISGPVGQAVEPARETPLLFGCPHAPVRFGVGGTLVVVTPTSPSEYSNATVQLIQLKVVMSPNSHMIHTDSLFCSYLLLQGCGTRVQALYRRPGVPFGSSNTVSSASKAPPYWTLCGSLPFL